MASPIALLKELKKRVERIEAFIDKLGNKAAEGDVSAATERIPAKIADVVKDAKATAETIIGKVEAAITESKSK